MVVAWAADGIFARRYDGTGIPLGTAFQVNTYTPVHHALPSVGIAGNGDFVVVWTSYYQDGGKNGVFGQRFDSTGAPVPGEVPIGGARLVIRDGSPSRRSIAFQTKDVRTGNGINPLISPVIQGASLQVFNTAGSGESICLSLPASGWTAVGTPNDPVFIYRDRDFAHGPCNIARIRRGRFFRASCRASVQPISYSLDEPAQGSVGVSLTIGPATYCANFGGTIPVDSGAARRFKGVNAPPPATCPSPPVSCP
jgi:hypothetical protein